MRLAQLVHRERQVEMGFGQIGISQGGPTEMMRGQIPLTLLIMFNALRIVCVPGEVSGAGRASFDPTRAWCGFVSLLGVRESQGAVISSTDNAPPTTNETGLIIPPSVPSSRVPQVSLLRCAREARVIHTI